MLSDQTVVVNGAIETYGDEIRAFVRARLHYDMVDDLMQELWLRLGRVAEHQEINDLRAWLYRVARNLITDTYRRSQVRPTFVDLDVSSQDAIVDVDYDVDMDDEDQFWERFEEALQILPKNQHEVFVRNELEGETLLQIAQDLGEPLKTIISRKNYAKQKLRQALSDLYVDYFYED